MRSTPIASIVALAALAAASLGLVGPAFGSCLCPPVDPTEVVKHATRIVRVQITKATNVKTDCGGLNQPSCGIDFVARLEYFKGTGPSDGEDRITNTDPYFCGFSVKTGDELLAVEGEAPSLGLRTEICVVYATLNDRRLIERFREIALQSQSGNP